MEDNQVVYKKQLVAIDLKKMVRFSIWLVLLPFALFLIVNCLIIKSFKFDISIGWLIAFIPIYFILIVVHELLHALGYYIFSKGNAKGVKFGIIPKQALAYCHCIAPMSVNVYRGVLLLPVLVIGIIPFVVATILGNIYIGFLSALLISGGAGDFIMFWQLKSLPRTQIILDHPKAPAYYLCYEENQLPDDFIEVTDEQEIALQNSLHLPPDAGKDKQNH